MEKEYHSELFDIRRVCESDKELFREVAKAEYLFGRIYDVEPDIGINVYWEGLVGDATEKNYSVFLNNGDFLGRLALQGLDNEFPELAIIIIKKYQGQGYGEPLLREWLNWVQATMGYRRIDVKIDRSNTRSVRLFQKLKAIVDQDGDIIYCHLDLPLEERKDLE